MGRPRCNEVRALVAALALAAPPAVASQHGRDGFSGNPEVNGGATCATCHTPGAAPPQIVLSGPTQVQAGATVSYLVGLLGGPGVTGGVAVSSSGGLGTFAPVGSDLVVFGDEITHAQPKAFADGVVAFQLLWTAPPYNGDVTLFAAGNSTNGQLDLQGDAIATTQRTVTVTGGVPGPPDPPDPPPTAATLEPFASGLSRPVAIANAGDQRLFVVEQLGRIRIVEPDGSVRPVPFLDIESIVHDAGSEQGLLGLAFHPAYASNGHFFVYYTYEPVPGGPDFTRVSRFTVSPDPDAADPASEQVLLEFQQLAANHNGGDLHFGPDGYLWIASGDGGGAGDTANNAQNRSNLMGKLLRIDVDGGGGPPDCDASGEGAYGVPVDNAFADGRGGAGCDEIWALGLRNPWRFSFDRDTGDLWIADVGQNAREEIDFVPAGTASGLNLGWRCWEGDLAYNLSGCAAEYFEPVHVTEHADGNCSITGGFVYRGRREYALHGRYFFSDVCNSRIQVLVPDGSGFEAQTAVAAGSISVPVAFGEDAAGELYVASHSGSVMRIRTDPDSIPVLPWAARGMAALAVLAALALGRARST